MTDTVTIPARAATWLVAHALTHTDGWEQPEDEHGCCPACCAPCGALLALLSAGQLDDIARAYVEPGGMDRWDDANNRVDRAWLARAWREFDCVDHHEGDEPYVRFRSVEEWDAYLSGLGA